VPHTHARTHRNQQQLHTLHYAAQERAAQRLELQRALEERQRELDK
jgi:hypothetical protein